MKKVFILMVPFVFVLGFLFNNTADASFGLSQDSRMIENQKEMYK